MTLLLMLMLGQTPVEGEAPQPPPAADAAAPAQAEPVEVAPAPAVAPPAAPPAPPPVAAVVAAQTEAVRPRVFFARIESASADVDVALLSDTIVAEARRHTAYEVVSVSDVKGVVDLTAEQAAMGCDTVSCASEVADALGAPQLVIGKLGRIGGTWVLTLSRIDRQSLRAVGSAKIERAGDTPEVLLPELPAAVATLLGSEALIEASGPPLLGIGIGIAALGGASLAVGGGLYLLAARELELGLASKDAAVRKQHKATGEPLYFGSIGAAIFGGVALAAGVSVIVADFVIE